MKIRSATANNHKHLFEIRTYRGAWTFPYARACPPPSATDPIVDVRVDPELASEAFTYRLRSEEEGTIHIEQVLDDNRDPGYLRQALLYKLTAEARSRVRESGLSRRELIRRLGTSPAQFYRLLDPTNSRKSVDRMLELLQVLGCDVELVVRP